MTVKRLTRTSLDYEKILGSIPRMGIFAIKNFAEMFFLGSYRACALTGLTETQTYTVPTEHPRSRDKEYLKQ